MNNIIMHEPGLIELMVEEYFALRTHEKLPPNIPSLALFIGFNGTKDIANALEAWDKGESKYPEKSIGLIIKAITMIEDYTLSMGMKSVIPAALVKFTLGAYHGVKEPSNNSEGPTNAIQIVFADEERHQLSGSVGKHQLKHVKQNEITFDGFDIEV